MARNSLSTSNNCKLVAYSCNFGSIMQYFMVGRSDMEIFSFIGEFSAHIWSLKVGHDSLALICEISSVYVLVCFA